MNEQTSKIQNSSISLDKKQAAFVLSVIILLILANLLKALAPERHSDPLYYHLFVAWEWGKAGRYIHFEHQPWYLQSGIYEYWMAICSKFFERKEAFHAAMQIMHYFFGGVVSSFLVFKITRRFCDVRFSLLAVLFFLGIPVEKYILFYAKNDGFLLCVLIAALACYERVINYPRAKLSVFGFALFLSLAMATKHNALFFILPWIFVFGLYSWRGVFRFNGSFIYFCIFMIILLPLSLSTLARNFYFTGNPFFPGLYKLFPSPQILHPLAQYWVDAFTKSPAPFLVSLFFQFKHYVLSKPIYAVAFFKQQHVFFKHLQMLAFSSLVILAILTGKGVGLRFGFFFFALFSITSIVWLYEFSSKRYLSNVFFWILFFFGIASSGIDVSTRHAIFRGFPILVGADSFEGYLSRNNPQYDFHKWIAKNLNQQIRILSPDHDMRFYLEKQEIYSGASSYIACEVIDAKSYSEALEIFRKNSFTHIQIEPNFTNFGKIIWQDPRFREDFHMVLAKNGFELWELKRKN